MSEEVARNKFLNGVSIHDGIGLAQLTLANLCVPRRKGARIGFKEACFLLTTQRIVKV